MQRSPTGRIDETQARNWFRQILSALAFLQKKGVCHRDLCMENMIIDDRDDVQIIDFGLCLRVPYGDPNNRNLVTDVSGNTVRRLIKAQGQGGRWPYVSPEVAMRHECFDGFAIDLWAVGIVLFEFLIGKKPFAMPNASDKNFHTIAIEGNLTGLLQMKGISLDKEACDLLQKMLQFDPSKRLTLAEVVSHPWVNRGYTESKPKQILRTVEETQNRWFIQNNAINNEEDLNEYELAHRLRINSCSSADDITADSTDEESRNPRGSTSIPYNISDEQLSEKTNRTNNATAVVQNDETTTTVLDDEMLDRISNNTKKKGFISFLKNPKKLWKNHKQKTSTLTTIESEVSAYDDEDAAPKAKMCGDGRMC
jgi:serine/threonine protein kinase